MSYSIRTIAALIGAEHIGHCEGVVEWLLTDSRSLCFPEETLFFALVSKRGDGHHYIAELYERGVRHFVVSERPDDAMLHACPEAGFLIVEDTLAALQRLGEKHRKAFDIPVVGITGSNGKTIVKEWLSQLLGHSLNVARSPRSYNSQVGVPLSVWQINKHTQIALIEAGISEPHEMPRLQQIVSPTIGVLTNIGGAHQENFSSLQEKCSEKLALFRDSEVIIFNGDDELIMGAIEQALPSIRKMAWSRTHVDMPLYIASVKTEDKSSTITYCYQGTEGYYTLPFADEASIENSIRSEEHTSELQSQ